MDGVIDSAVSEFTLQPASDRTLSELIKQIHSIEANQSTIGTHHMPFKRSPSRLSPSLKEKLVGHLPPADAGNQLSASIIIVGTKMRLHCAKKNEIEATTSHISMENAATLNTSTLLEACNILHAQREWKQLQLCAETAISRADNGIEIQPVFCDWFVLSVYKLLMPFFKKNQLHASHIDAFDTTITQATRCLSKRSRNRIFYSALVANLRKNLPLAIELILEAQQVDGAMIGYFQRMMCFKSPAVLRTEKHDLLAKLDAKCDHNFIHHNGAEPVLLISTDQMYFDKYIEKMLESFGHGNPDGLIHLHCVAFTPQKAWLVEMERRYKVKINFTTDPQKQFLPGSDNFIGYCAGARYLHLPTYLAHYDRIAIADIDGVIRGTIHKIWRDNPDAILLTGKLLDPAWHSARLLWEIFAAGIFGISSTPNNRRFAEFLSAYLCEAMISSTKSEAPFFSADQTGLLLAYLHYKNECVFEPCPGFYAQGGNWRFSEQDGKRIAQENENFRKS